MKIAKTIAVAGLLAMSSTAADASTFGWGSWSWSSSSHSYSSHSSSYRSVLSSRSHRVHSYFTRSSGRSLASLLRRIRVTYSVPTRPSTPEPTSDVPLPAGGLLLVGAMGALALSRRKKT